MPTGIHRFLASKLLVNPPSIVTLAFSLRLAPFLSASDSPALHTGSSDSPSLAHSQFLGLPPPLFLLTASSDTLASSLRLMPPLIDSISYRGHEKAGVKTGTQGASLKLDNFDQRKGLLPSVRFLPTPPQSSSMFTRFQNQYILCKFFGRVLWRAPGGWVNRQRSAAPVP